jgi:hypothetical protein
VWIAGANLSSISKLAFQERKALAQISATGAFPRLLAALPSPSASSRRAPSRRCRETAPDLARRAPAQQLGLCRGDISEVDGRTPRGAAESL